MGLDIPHGLSILQAYIQWAKADRIRRLDNLQVNTLMRSLRFNVNIFNFGLRNENQIRSWIICIYLIEYYNDIHLNFQPQTIMKEFKWPSHFSFQTLSKKIYSN